MIIQNFSLLTPMKKITRLLFRILTSFCIISWIYFSQHYFTEKIEKNQSITWEKQDQKSNIFSLSWSIPQFTITPQNTYDVVIKTGENLLYRNEIYGFQILLDKKRGTPVRIQSEENPIHGKMVTLYMQYQGKYDFPLSIYVKSHQDYHQWLDEAKDDLIYDAEYLKLGKLWENKKRVFWYFGTTLSHGVLLQYFPEMGKQCEPSNDGYGWRNCGEDPLKLIMLTGFSTFDIE